MKTHDYFRNKVGIITGAATGIGRATAIEFAKAGSRLILADRDDDQCKETLKLIESFEGNAITIHADVSIESHVQKMVNEAILKFGTLDFAFNNAGIEGKQSPFVEGSLQNFNQVISINLTGVWLCMKYELNQMLKNGSGVIVNNASILGQVGFAGAAPYTAAKHGVIGLTQVAALEYSAKNVRINSVCPGFIETPMLERAGLLSDPRVKEMIASKHAMNRLGKAQEIADVVLWLCSPQSSFVTGQAIYVDGGYTSQ